jgi:Protein kinase domain
MISDIQGSFHGPDADKRVLVPGPLRPPQVKTPQTLASGGSSHYNQAPLFCCQIENATAKRPVSSSGRNLALASIDSAALEAEFERFESAWQSGKPPDIEQFVREALGGSTLRDGVAQRQFLVELVAIDLERRWRAKARDAQSSVTDRSGDTEIPGQPRLEDYERRFHEIKSGGKFPLDLIGHEYRIRKLWGDQPPKSEYLARFASQAESLENELARIDQELGTHGSHIMPVTVAMAPPTAPPVAPDGVRRGSKSEAPPPARIGRFQISGVLGSGGFGVVYRALDTDLRREVALKVPRPECITAFGGTAIYLSEARNIAALDHPGIVPVYEVASCGEAPCYLVSKLMEGGSLEQVIGTARPIYEKSAELIAGVAEALHHAHQCGLVHRDIKPANILLDSRQNALLADFGLAMQETDFGSGPGFVGTLAYMSPEQARHQSHLVDGRSDIFSLGLILFELLSGRSPYRGKSRQSLMAEIIACQPRPVRQLKADVPQELDRICQKARALRPSDRYGTAQDFADELRAFVRRRAQPAPSGRRWWAAALVAVVLLAAVGLWSLGGRSAPTGAPLVAPELILDRVVDNHFEPVTESNMPLAADAQLVLEASMPKQEAGHQAVFWYVFQCDDDQPPKLIWPVNLNAQEKRDELRSEIIGLDGPPRRIMFLAAASHTRIAAEDLQALEGVRFSLDKQVSRERPWKELCYPDDFKRPVERSSRNVDAWRLRSAPERELRKYFTSFSAVVLYFRDLDLP